MESLPVMLGHGEVASFDFYANSRRLRALRCAPLQPQLNRADQGRCDGGLGKRADR
jgi:hypothetical protein